MEEIGSKITTAASNQPSPGPGLYPDRNFIIKTKCSQCTCNNSGNVEGLAEDNYFCGAKNIIFRTVDKNTAFYSWTRENNIIHA